ncbi:MAG: hypothetical protein M3245_04195 [Actinomycetota bacterium]|nr:hypothetical protein [Actinomycetota bacterium]
MRRLRALVPCAVLAALVPVATPLRALPPPDAPACRVFPRNNVWNTRVDRLPRHPRNADWLATMEASTTRLHPDFGPSDGFPYGIPYEVVPGSHRKVAVEFLYADESDAGPYPFDGATPIEGGPGADGDRHALMIDRDRCVLYELFDAHWNGGSPRAGSGAIFDLSRNLLRPAGWTSADAAGLPVFPGLVRLDEVRAGRIDHAIRFTARRTDRRFIWPARHQAGEALDPTLPPMGARFRLKRSFDIEGYRDDTRVILRAMKRYGLILADNGSNWFFQGTAEPGWPAGMLDELKRVPASAFEAVDTGPLRIAAGSARARQYPRLTAELRPASIQVGERAVVSGTVRPAADRTVILQRLSDGAWREVSRRAPNPDGSYRFAVRPSTEGTRTYRVRVPADRLYFGATSAPMRLRVSSP